MRHFPVRWIGMLVATTVVCAGCETMGNLGFGANSGDTKSTETNADLGDLSGLYGDEYAVRVTIGTIKTQGSLNRLGSHAIRLPEQPLSEISVFNYQFPSSCGGHEFRVYEADSLQILEYEYAPVAGRSYVIRDYVSASNPFVKPGLWTAYDHTADSIATMSSQFEKRGYGMFNGVYSQGLVTNLPAEDQLELGNAYRRALGDVNGCSDTPAYVDVSTE